MKKLIPLVILFLVLVYLPSCTDDDSITPSDVSNTLISGAWRISHFSEDSDDETESFSDYQFIFTVTSTNGPPAGLVEASNGTSDVVGSWQTGTSDKSAKLTLDFGITPFDELNEDWKVLERTDTMIKLEHISGGNGGTDNLTFERI